MKTIYLLIADCVIYGVYTNHVTARSRAKQYSNVENLELVTIHPEEKNVLFDMEDYLETEDCEFVDDEETISE